jgi:hypothetical protein
LITCTLGAGTSTSIVTTVGGAVGAGVVGGSVGGGVVVGGDSADVVGDSVSDTALEDGGASEEASTDVALAETDVFDCASSSSSPSSPKMPASTSSTTTHANAITHHLRHHGFPPPLVAGGCGGGP